jgi:hypothetical protein
MPLEPSQPTMRLEAVARGDEQLDLSRWRDVTAADSEADATSRMTQRDTGGA